MGHQNIWYSHPRKFGPGFRYCRVCANHHGIIRKYALNICRFRQYAADIGFKKLDNARLDVSSIQELQLMMQPLMDGVLGGPPGAWRWYTEVP
ncbi:TRAPPC11 [Cordylochernes scorpioides]|uniref:TRAPPC11 n=1 Tax=Cordylochernes scorpioides TaxID=51811 RepID=A0ABY6K1G4_9ARAC|nr:TRAPPC11 [Cordylochernes scorpioides]